MSDIIAKIKPQPIQIQFGGNSKLRGFVTIKEASGLKLIYLVYFSIS